MLIFVIRLPPSERQPVCIVRQINVLAYTFKVQAGKYNHVLLSDIEGDSDELSGETRLRIALAIRESRLDQSKFLRMEIHGVLLQSGHV